MSRDHGASLLESGTPWLRWSTTSHGSPAVVSADDLASLGLHLLRCDGLRGRMFGLHLLVDDLRTFAASRIVTTVALVMCFGAATYSML